MFRTVLIALAAGSLSAAPAIGQGSGPVSQQREKQIQKTESTGESNSQKQLGGLKKDRQISQQMFRSSHNRMLRHSRAAGGIR
jgi:hypothetical protein